MKQQGGAEGSPKKNVKKPHFFYHLPLKGYEQPPLFESAHKFGERTSFRH
jgi:hypothetical protein